MTPTEEQNIWDIYTSKEEYNPSYKDQFDRFCYWNSSNRSILTPIVSNYLFQKGFRPVYPEGKSFAICLSHDIDILYNNYKGFNKVKQAISSLKKGSIKDSLSIALNKKKIPSHLNVQNLIKINQKYGAKSSFYFLALKEGDWDYNFNVENIQSTFDSIAKAGSEIGLHGGHKAFEDSKTLKEEKDRLENATPLKLNGYRNHYLRFKTPDTWQLLEDIGIEYDSTLGFADSIGFRSGMCYPYSPFNLNKNKYFQITEIPLIIMDGSLWTYMRLNQEDQLKICKELIDKVKDINGVITLNWHNTCSTGYPAEIYEKLIQYGAKNNAWFPTTQELVSYWKEMKYNEQIQDLMSDLKKKYE